MTALIQQFVSAVVEEFSSSCSLAVTSGVLVRHDTRAWSSQPVMGLSTEKYQLDERTGGDADQDVQGEPFNKHSGSDGMKTVSIYTELDELIATSERERRTLRSERVPYSESADHTTSAMDRPRVCAEGSALTRLHDNSTRQHSTNRTSWRPILDVASHTWVPSGHPQYPRAYFGREAVGDSTTTRNTDKKVYSTHVTLNTKAKVRLSRSRSDFGQMVVQQEVRA